MIYPRSRPMVLRSKKLDKVSLAEVGSPSEPVASAEASDEIFVQAAIDAEADAKAGAIAGDASRAILEDILASHPDVAAEAEAAQDVLQRAEPFVFILGLLVHERQRGSCFSPTAGSLVCQALRFGGRLLGLRCRRLGLFGAALHFLGGGIGLLGCVQQLLQLGLELIQLLAAVPRIAAAARPGRREVPALPWR